MKWVFTPDQFALAWESTGFDRYPYPLSIRLSARTEDERAGQIGALQRWRDRTVDGDVEAALRILAQPASRVEVFGLVGTDVSRPVRVLGATAGDTGVVVAQSCGGELAVSMGHAESMPARVVGVLPKSQPGRGPERTAPLAEVQRDSRDVITASVRTKSVAGQVRRVLNLPRDGIGQLLVGTRLNEGVDRALHSLSWIDVANDGRYLVRTRDDVEVIPASNEVFAKEIRRTLVEAD